jgi:hypothetical protein
LSGAFLLFFSNSLFALELDSEWLNLLHYKKTLFNQWESEADSEKFFLSINGKTSPLDEMLANITAMNLPATEKEDHARCKFPARYHYLDKKKLINESTRKIQCADLEHFLKLLNPSGASLIFSSYYLETASSTFGHTFLKIIRKDLGDTTDTDLLNYAVNYGAHVTTENALLYGLYGLIGGFAGEFSSLPYFYKVREYNDHESRDLWEYKLNLTQDEITKLAEHIWEMKQNYFTYFYLTENCSYHMLALLDAVNPKWKLTNRNPYFVIPSDTIKTAMNTPGLIKSVEFSPSKRRIAMSHINSLSDDELKELKNTLKTNSLDTDFSKRPEQSQVKILDALIESMDFLFAGEILLKEGKASEVKHQYLSARSMLSDDTTHPEIITPSDEAPHLGHKSRRLKFTQYWPENNQKQNLELRVALNDLLDPLVGQARLSTMEMGKFSLSHLNNENKFKIDEITWVNVVSLNPWNNFLKPLSWRGWFGSKTINDKSCQQCMGHGVSAAFGIAQDYKDFLFYTMAGAEAIIGSSQLDKDHYRFSFFPEAHLLFRKNYFALDIFGIYQRFILHEVKDQMIWGGKLNFSPFTNWSIGTEYKQVSQQDEVAISLAHFF